MKQFNHILTTAGDGYWSEVSKPVTVAGLELITVNVERTFGELRVYFDTATWNIERDGLIYTDSRFLEELRGVLGAQCLPGKVDYSEQGMQGDDYLSLDVDEVFIQSWETAND